MNAELTIRLKQLDESTKVLRQNSKAPVRAPSVSGIGTVGTYPRLLGFASDSSADLYSREAGHVGSQDCSSYGEQSGEGLYGLS
jgi:hypothetical protein